MISRPERDDLNQVAAIAAWKAESTWDGRCPLAAWKAIKARGARLSYARAWTECRKAGVTVSPEFDMPSTPAYPCEPRLYRAIAALPAHYQRIVSLKFWHGLTSPEISAALGIPPRTVDTAVANIITELKRTICFTPDFSRESSRLRYWQPPR